MLLVFGEDMENSISNLTQGVQILIVLLDFPWEHSVQDKLQVVHILDQTPKTCLHLEKYNKERLSLKSLLRSSELHCKYTFTL